MTSQNYLFNSEGWSQKAELKKKIPEITLTFNSLQELNDQIISAFSKLERADWAMYRMGLDVPKPKIVRKKKNEQNMQSKQ